MLCFDLVRHHSNSLIGFPMHSSITFSETFSSYVKPSNICAHAPEQTKSTHTCTHAFLHTLSHLTYLPLHPYFVTLLSLNKHVREILAQRCPVCPPLAPLRSTVRPWQEIGGNATFQPAASPAGGSR